MLPLIPVDSWCVFLSHEALEFPTPSEFCARCLGQIDATAVALMIRVPLRRSTGSPAWLLIIRHLQPHVLMLFEASCFPTHVSSVRWRPAMVVEMVVVVSECKQADGEVSMNSWGEDVCKHRGASVMEL